MRSVSLKLPDQLDQKITAIARRKRSNRSAVMREALEAFTASAPAGILDLISQGHLKVDFRLSTESEPHGQV